MKRFNAFTLAEVLITLGIIGVVAAMTLPTLIQNHQKQVYVTQLKKSISVIQQGFKKMMADEEVDNLWYTEMFANSGYFDDGREFIYQSGDNTEFYQPILKRYFKVVKFDDENSAERKVKNLNDSEILTEMDFAYIYLPDGSIIGFDGYTPNGSDIVTYLFIDVNGDKGPNQYGRDVFRDLVLTPQGLIKPYRENQDCVSLNGQSGCYQKIVKDGWKMNY